MNTSTADLYEEWERRYKATPELDRDFRTLSGDEVKPLYTEARSADASIRSACRVSTRSRAACTRACTGAGGGRCVSSRGSAPAEETNERFRYLLDHGQQGLSTAFDMPSLMGHDSDHKMSLGEVGREGVAIDTPDDMETLFQGIDLGATSVSMTVNAPAAIMMAYYVVAAERAGVPRDRLAGTVQADILKEYIAQKEWCFPVDPAMRLMGDLIEWCTKEMPRWHPVSISGYHIREAGSTAAQELAFTLKDGLTYVEQAVERGLDVDDFAPRLSFFFNAQIDFFEEIAKYRAARRIWARELRETFGATNPRSWLMRFHTQTAGVSLTAQQPLNNVVRTAIEALAGVLGGTQSLHTNSYDEALALPSEEAVRVAVRTQQIIAHETGVTEHHRSARRLLRRRGADRRDGAPVLRVLRQDRPARRHGRRGQGGLPAARDRRGLLRAADPPGPGPADRGRRQRVHRGRRRRARDCCASTPPSSASRSTASRACAPSGTPPTSRPP